MKNLKKIAMAAVPVVVGLIAYNVVWPVAQGFIARFTGGGNGS